MAQIEKHRIEKNSEGEFVIIETVTVEVPDVEAPSIDDVIADKEAKVLEMYEELQALKAERDAE